MKEPAKVPVRINDIDENAPLIAEGTSKKVMSIPSATSLFLRTSTPFVASSLVNMSGIIACNYFLSRFGSDELAASSLMLAVQTLITTSSSGVLFATGIHVAKAVGEKKPKDVGDAFRNAMLISVGLSLVGATLACTAQYTLPLLGQDEKLVAIAQKYFYPFSASLLATFGTIVTSQVALASGHSKLVLATYILNNALLIGQAYPAVLGIEGILEPQKSFGYGMALLLSSWETFAALSLYMALKSEFRAYSLYSNIRNTTFACMRKVFSDGVGIAGQLTAEEIALMSMTLLIGHSQVSALEAFQIVNQYHFPLIGIIFSAAHAAGVLVSQYEGEKNSRAARRIGNTGIVTNTLFCVAAAVVMITMSQYLTELFVNDKTRSSEEIYSFTKMMFMYRACELFVDSIGNSAAGTLRGYSDTRASMLANVLSAIITVAGGAILNRLMGVEGLFVGRLASLVSTRIYITHRWITKSKYMVDAEVQELPEQQVNATASNNAKLILSGNNVASDDNQNSLSDTSDVQNNNSSDEPPRLSSNRSSLLNEQERRNARINLANAEIEGEDSSNTRDRRADGYRQYKYCHLL